MIKFFRKIRYNLLSEGKTGKYLKYAIGEIILVVIGILIALQINNWNENRKDRAKEQTILKEIHSDFSKNLNDFYPVKQNQINTLESGEIVFRNIKKLHSPTSRDSVFRNVVNMFGGYPYHPSNGVVESLISSGEVNLIRNDTLRRLLVSWKDVLSDYAEEVVFDRNVWTNHIEPYVIKYGDFLTLASPKNKKLLTDTVFVNMLVRKQFFQKNIVQAINGSHGLEHHLEEIVRLSKTE